MQLVKMKAQPLATHLHAGMNERASRRSLFIDASRGFAMFLVCVSHFGLAYFGQGHDRQSAELTSWLALPATPTFVLLSGLLLGYLSVKNRAGFPVLGLKLMDRGLFLLGPAHLLIMLAHLPAFRHARFIFVTDTIGVCLLVGPWLVRSLSRSARLFLGFGLVTFTWFLFLSWRPEGHIAGMLRTIFVGDAPFTRGWLAFPLLPWMGTYLMATPLGEWLAEWSLVDYRWISRLGLLSALTMTAGVAIHALGRGRSPALRELMSGLQKYPPGPAYLLAGGGGGGLGITFVMGWLERRRLLMRLLAGLAVVGRSSLVVFIFQYFVYYLALNLLRLPVSALWPVYLGASLVLIYGVALAWDRYVGNDYLTVGLLSLLRGRKGFVAPTRQ